MPKVRFRTNLGSIDAAKFGLDFRKCTIDAEAEVGETAAEALSKSGVVELLTTGKPAEMRAVPAADSVVDTKTKK